MSVEKQVLIALRRFGSSRTVHNHAMWAGVGYGTIDLCTRKVLTAIHSSNLKEAHVRWLVGQEKKKLSYGHTLKPVLNSVMDGVWLMGL